MIVRWLLPAVFALPLGVAACAEPPHTEMNQAQGAIDAARAAGAEKYATAEYTAAVDALKRAHDAVTQSDYRLALNHALDARERATLAARQAAETQAQVRGEVERTMAEVAVLLAQANARLEAARKARVPTRTVRQLAADVAAVSEDVQKAGELMKAGDYLAARPLLQEIKPRIENTVAAIDQATSAQLQRRRR